LPETLAAARRTPLRPGRLLRAHWHLLRAPRFLLLAASSALLFNGFFAYVLSAPAFLLKHLNLTPEQFYWLSFPAVAGIMGGSLLANRLSGRASHGLTIGAGFAVMLLAATLNVATSTQGSRALAVLPVAIYAFGMALATPSLTLLALDLFPGQRGIASGTLGLVQMSANSLSAALLAPVLSESARGLALGMVGFAAAALAAYVLAVWAGKPGSRRGPTSGPSGRGDGPV
ncbi:MAG: MFS transporter, partial [Pseudomonadota bacterium]